LISRLFRERQIGDYDFNPNITEDDIGAAEKMLSAISAYLKDNKKI